VLSVEDWAEIRRLRRAEKMPISEIARVLGVSRNTVKAALRSDGAPRYERRPAGSIVDVVEPRIRELLRAYPTMPATVIAERIGWTRSIRVLSSGVAELRPAYLPADPAGRTSYEPGEIGQCDLWFPPIQLPVGFGQVRKPTQLPVLTMVTGYSRWLSGLLIPTRTAADLFAGWWQVIERLGAVPRVLVWDGEGATASRPSCNAGRSLCLQSGLLLLVVLVLDGAAAAETFAGLRDSCAANRVNALDDVDDDHRIDYFADAALLVRRRP